MELHGLTVEQQLAWERDGFLVFENFLSEDEVRRYNETLDLAFEEWRRQGKPNPEFGLVKNADVICGIIEWDDAFLELLEHPRMMSILRDVMGDQFVMIDNDGMIKVAGAQTHTNWHRDSPLVLIQNGQSSPVMAKVFYFLADVQPDGGCLSFLPGSHHMSNDMLPRVERPEDLPGHVRMSVKAGTAVLFNAHTYHSAMSNYSDQARRSLIYNYGRTFLRTWPGYEPSDTLKTKAHTDLRRMLLGMHPWINDPKAFAE